MWQALDKLALAATVTCGLGNDFAADERLADEMLVTEGECR